MIVITAGASGGEGGAEVQILQERREKGFYK